MEKKLKAFIVDDDPETLSYIESLLREIGFATVTAARKLRGLRSLLRNKPDLLVLDLMLPGQDGIQLLDELAKSEMDTAIVITAESPERILNAAENFARMSGLRVLGSLRKQVWKQDLVKILDPLIGHGRVKPDIEEQEFFRLAASGALVNHYHPIVDAKRASVHRLIAVPRLKHPTMGTMSVAGFWDTAEAYSAVDEIHQRMLKTAIVEAVSLAKSGSQVAVSCNVPANHLAQTDFTDCLLVDCRKAGLLPSRLCIEVIESDLRQNVVPILGTLTRLGMRGVQLTIDEYGTGSLTGGMLARLPVSELTIGHQLIAATLRDGDARSRVIDVVEYGQRHGLEVIAKDVASPEHLGLLLDLGVTHFQGSVFSKPRAIEEMRYWLKNAPRTLADMGIVSRIRHTDKQSAV